jgi:ABC-2 type transport system ATP-binding protein
MSMIELRNLTKTYGEVEALRGISTTIERGEVVGLLGPNGAGKTTTMKILVGYLLPTSGTARVAGLDVTEDPLGVQRRIGYLPENAPLYADMLVQEYLKFVADMRELGEGAPRRIVAAAEQCAITDVMTRTIGHLSRGYRQRVGLAAAILHDPEILILDEPTSGLDPNQIVEVRDLIHRMGHTKTVILSTHILTEVEASCDRAVILIDGTIRADGRLRDLTQSRVQVVTLAASDPPEPSRVLESLAGVTRVERTAADGRFHTYRLHLREDAAVGEAVYDAARQRGWTLRELRRDDKTLEQVFRELTASTAGVAA